MRVGPGHDTYGKPYDFFVGFHCPNWPTDNFAIVCGLVTDEGSPLAPDIELTRAHVRATTERLAVVGLKAIWERARHMTKIETPHANTVESEDEHKKHLMAAASNIVHGHTPADIVSVGSVTEDATPEGKRRFTISNLVVDVEDKPAG